MKTGTHTQVPVPMTTHDYVVNNQRLARNKNIRNSSHFTYAIPRQNVLRLSCSAYLCRP